MSFWSEIIKESTSMIRFLTLLLLSLCSTSSFAHYEATVVSVYDGDTLKMDVQLWPEITQRISVRLRGVDAPEFRVSCKNSIGVIGKEAIVAARDKAIKRALAAKEWLVEQVRGQKVTIENPALGKYAGRIIADVYVRGVNLSTASLSAGHTVPYDGKKRQDWCLVA